MRRTLVAAMSIVMLAAVAFVGPASGGSPFTAPMYDTYDYVCDEGAQETDGPTYGTAKMKTKTDEFGNTVRQVQVKLKGAMSGATYQIYVTQVGDGLDGCSVHNATGTPWNKKAGELIVDETGAGTFEMVVPQLVANATSYWATAWNSAVPVATGGEPDILRSLLIPA